MAKDDARYEAWLARVEAEVASDVDPESYRRYFKQGLTPSEAVAADRQEFLAPSPRP